MNNVPGWFVKYWTAAERGLISAEYILRNENLLREKPIKMYTVIRTLHAARITTPIVHPLTDFFGRWDQ